MTVKEWLNRGWELDKEINQLLQSQREALTRATKTTCTSADEKVQTSKNNTTENKFVSYAEYSDMADKRIDELYEIKKEILAAVKELEDSTLRTLLIARYINFKTWEQIAAEMHYSYKHTVHILHPKALLKLKDVIECNIGQVL